MPPTGGQATTLLTAGDWLMDLHDNLFYGYRGPNTADSDRERQLENNVTKGDCSSEIGFW